MLQQYTLRIIFGVLLGTAISLRALKKKSLDLSGAVSGWIVAFVTCLGGVRTTVVLLTFFYTSTWLTGYKGEVKKVLEDGYKEGGSRNWEQVLANGFTGTYLVLCYLVAIGPEEVTLDFKQHSHASSLVAAYIGHYACCNADTWASELGILSTQSPRLITTLRQVPTGTNGGITFLGCFASFLGGLVIGLAFYVAEVVMYSIYGRDEFPALLPVLLLGAASGFFGSLIDSLLGATLQYSGWSKERKKVVAAPGPNVKHVSGEDILNNHHVNFLSSMITSALTGFFAHHLFELF